MKKEMAMKMVLSCVLVLELFGCGKTTKEKNYDLAVAEEDWLIAAFILSTQNPYNVEKDVQTDGVLSYYQAFLATADVNQIWQISEILDWVRENAPGHVEEFARKGYVFARQKNDFLQADIFIHKGSLDIDEATHHELAINVWLHMIFSEGTPTFKDLARWHPVGSYAREAFDYAMRLANFSAACAISKYAGLDDLREYAKSCTLDMIEKFDSCVQREDFESALKFMRTLGSELSADKVQMATMAYYNWLMKNERYKEAYGIALHYNPEGAVAAYEALYRASLESGHFKIIVRPSGHSSASEPLILLE